MRATLEYGLTGPVDPALVTEGAGLLWFWYDRGKVHEGARWLEAAVRHAHPGPDGLAVRVARATALMLLGQEAPARPVAGWSRPLLGCAASAWTLNRGDICGAVSDRAAPLVAAAGDADLDVIAEVVACVPGLGATDPGELVALAERAAAAHERAVALDNVCATWMACAVRLGAGGTGVYVEAMANFLVMRGDLDEAVRLYSWAYRQTRRAWERGAALTLDEIMTHQVCG